MELTSENTVKTIFPTRLVFGKNTFLNPETSATRFFKRNMQKLASTFATTAIFPMERGFWA